MSCLQRKIEVPPSSLGRGCIVLLHMQHHHEDIFPGELSDVSWWMTRGVEILTSDNLPSGRLLEELALSDYRLWPRSFPDSNFDHIDRAKKYFASGNPRNASFTSTKTVPGSKSLHDLEGLVRAPVSITCSPEIFQWLQTNFNYPLLIKSLFSLKFKHWCHGFRPAHLKLTVGSW